jgi:hypothetical protein
VRDQVSHPYKTTGKIIVLYIILPVVWVWNLVCHIGGGTSDRFILKVVTKLPNYTSSHPRRRKLQI